MLYNHTIDNKNETPKRQRYGREANRKQKAGLVTSSEVGVVEIESVFSGGDSWDYQARERAVLRAIPDFRTA